MATLNTSLIRPARQKIIVLTCTMRTRGMCVSVCVCLYRCNDLEENRPGVECLEAINALCLVGAVLRERLIGSYIQYVLVRYGLWAAILTKAISTASC